ncbi:glycosyltransferase [Vannielia litorea]|uniref:glycosyltransferase n=1 Tax=Vannielia litorea TaxID=1217970 RepID=UPI001BCDFAA5|nr:glycosyltransferase [Vannielia litorea]MBS8225590.1 glycosyltransferase [Vannielia litorea]
MKKSDKAPETGQTWDTHVTRPRETPGDRPVPLDAPDAIIGWTTSRRPSIKRDDRPAKTKEVQPSPPTAWPARVQPTARLFRGKRHGKHEGALNLVIASFGGAAWLTRAASQARRYLSSGDWATVIVMTDSADHRALGEAGCIVEYFPPRIYEGSAATSLFTARFRQLWSKWGAKHLVDLGKPGVLRSRLEAYDGYFEAGVEQVARRPFNPKREQSQPAAPAVTDIAALKAEYRAKAKDREEDSFVLYRILGNDLPPRHENGQTLKNLRFILENEEPFPGVEKRWVVNRLTNPDDEQRIIATLEEFNQPYLHIPFSLKEYQSIEWDLDSFPDRAFFLRGNFFGMAQPGQRRAEAHSRRLKNRYVMNNNGARNAALRDGRNRAKWVLPWDGNCFLTRFAWDEIQQAVTDAPYMKYFTVPMARITENRELLDPHFLPNAVEEPQILFRNDAAEEFDEARQYGRRPKVELFWRLGIPGPWDDWWDDVWELPRPAQAAEAGACGSAGWVARLHSGQSPLEESSREALLVRGQARDDAICILLDSLDRQAIARVHAPEKLALYCEETLSTLSAAPPDTAKGQLYSRLLQEAELALQRPASSVTDKSIAPPGGTLHDYFPQAAELEIPDDPGMAPALSDRVRLGEFIYDATILALAGAAAREGSFSAGGAALVRRWFVEPATRMSPNLNFAELAPGGKAEMPGGRLAELRNLPVLLDAIRLLVRSGAMSPEDKTGFDAWLAEYAGWIRAARDEVPEDRLACEIATGCELQQAAIAAYLSDVETLAQVFRRSRERLLVQFDAKGRPRGKSRAAKVPEVHLSNLLAWANLATIAEQCGDRLWDFSDGDGPILARAFGAVLDIIAKLANGGTAEAIADIDGYLPAVFIAQARYLPARATGGALAMGRRPLFAPDAGIMPFWMFAKAINCVSTASGEASETSILRAARWARERQEQDSDALHEIEDLEKLIWGGYPALAERALLRLRQQPNISDPLRAHAARALARWQSYNNDYAEALENYRFASRLSKLEAKKGLLPYSSALLQMGNRDEARDLVLEALRENADDSNLFYQVANTYAEMGGDVPGADTERQLDWINKVFLTKGMLPIQRRDRAAPLGIFNIEAVRSDARPVAVEADRKVSVVVPVFNGEDTIGNALRSVQEQTYTNLEIIVVDDCSTDRTFDILTELEGQDPRIRVAQTSENGGAYVARNLGMRQATGALITVHDADDWSHPQKIERQIQRLDTCHGALGVMSYWVRMREDLYVEGFWRPEQMHISLNQSSLLFSRALLDEIGMWDDVRAGADNEFIWRFRTKYGESSVATTDRSMPLSFSLVRDESLTRQGVTHVRTVLHGLRKDYHRTYRRWQKAVEAEDLVLPSMPPGERAFPAPAPILPSRSQDRSFDRVYIADFSRNGASGRAVLDLVRDSAALEGKTGIFHWPDYETSSDFWFDQEIADLIDDFAVEQISAWDAVQADALYLCDPLLARYEITGLPEFTAPEVQVLCPRPGAKDTRLRRMPTREELEALFSLPCRWVNFGT